MIKVTDNKEVKETVQTTTICRDNSGWRPYDTGTFISYASNGITLSDEGTCK